MSWNYRIVRLSARKDASQFELREVYYDECGKPRAVSASAPHLYGESPEEVLEVLERALKSAKELPVFDTPVEWTT